MCYARNLGRNKEKNLEIVNQAYIYSIFRGYVGTNTANYAIGLVKLPFLNNFYFKNIRNPFKGGH